MRGRPPRLSDGDKHELWLYRTTAGVSIEQLSLMWKIGKRRVLQILAEQYAKFGERELPQHKRHLVRRRQMKETNSVREA